MSDVNYDTLHETVKEYAKNNNLTLQEAKKALDIKDWQYSYSLKRKKVDKNKKINRREYTPLEKESHVKAFEESKLSINQYAKDNNLPPSSFRAWMSPDDKTKIVTKPKRQYQKAKHTETPTKEVSMTTIEINDSNDNNKVFLLIGSYKNVACTLKELGMFI
jgi:transposase-like protein